MAQKTSNELSKILLVASDMAYGADDPLLQPLRSTLQHYEDTGALSFAPPYGVDRGYVLDRTFVREVSGFKAIALRHQTTGEVILAFAGTDGPDSKDWISNARFGWTQWVSARDEVLAYLASLRTLDGVLPFTGKIHFTGQSLGGGLAEYAAYEFLIRAGSEIGRSKARVSVTTFNGFGATYALRDSRLSGLSNFDADLLRGVSAGAAYYIANDQVSRLGDGHVGIDQYLLDYRSPSISKTTGKPYYLDPIDAHRIESGFYAKLHPALQFNEAKKVPNDPLVIENLQRYAALLGALSNDRFPQVNEGRFNLGGALAAAITIGATSGETRDVLTLSRALIRGFEVAGAFDRSSQDTLGTAAGKLLTLIKYEQIANLIVLGSIPFGTTKLLYHKLGELLSAATAADEKGRDAIKAGFKRFVDADIFVGEVDADSVLRAELVFSALPGVRGDGRFTPLFSNKDLDIETFVQVVTNDEGPWLLNTIAYLSRQARPESVSGLESERWIKFQVDLLVAIGAEANAIGSADPEFVSSTASAIEEFLLVDFAQSLANAYSERTVKYAEARANLFGNTVLDFQSYDLLFDALNRASKDPNYAGIKPALDRALSAVKRDGEVVVITPATDVNPFVAPGPTVDPRFAHSVRIEEQQVKMFSVFLPYEAQGAGQHIRVRIEGPAASEIELLLDGGGVGVAAGGPVQLLIEEGDRSVRFGLWAKGDVSVDQALTLSATLEDEHGVQTHKTNLELHLLLDARNEGATATSAITGTANADALSAPAGPASTSARVLNGLGGHDLLRGGEGNDRLEGGAGNDYLTGGPGDDRFAGGDGGDFIVLGRGLDYAEGGAGDDFFGYWGSDVVPMSVLAVGGWPFYFGADFRWGAAITQNPASGYLELSDVGVSTVPWSSTTLGITKGAERLPLPAYPLDAANTDRHAVYGGGGNDIIVAGPNADTLFGDDGDDFVLGMRGDDTIFGGLGNDRLAGHSGDDYIDGGAGDDELDGEDGADTLVGGPGADVLRGDVHLAAAPFQNHGDDYLDGGDGNDLLVGYSGADMLFGGEGADVLHGDADFVPLSFQGDDYLDGEGGDDVLLGYGGDDALYGGAGHDDLRGGVGNDYLDGEDGDDVLSGDAGEDELFGGAGHDWLQGGADADYLDGGDDSDTLLGEAGDDTLIGGSGDDTLEGGLGDDAHYGGGGNDLIFGQDGDDVLAGGAGADKLVGGPGRDTYLFGHGDGQDRIEESASAELNILSMGAGVLPTQVALHRAPNSSELIVALGDAGDRITIPGWYREVPGSTPHVPSVGLLAIGEIHFADGTIWDARALAARLNAPTPGGDQLTGIWTDDEIHGFGGADRLSGGSGDDRLFGEEDNDVLLGGRGSDALSGGEGNDRLEGHEEADVLDGGPGDDYLVGGPGDDVYVFDRGHGRDTIEEALGSADTDTIVLGPGIRAADVLLAPDAIYADRYALKIVGSSDAIVFAAGTSPGSYAIERITFEDGVTWGSAEIAQRVSTVTGTSVSDYLRATPWNDVITAGDGYDTVDAGAGDDIIDGGPGNDTLRGGAGSDTYLYARGMGDDTIFDAQSAALGLDTIRFAAGISSSSIVLSENYLSLRVTFSDGPGSITVSGWFAQDDYRGTLRFVFADGSTWDAAAIAARTPRIQATAQMDRLYGTPSADAIHGLDGSDELHGAAGDDRIEGGNGDDVLYGGSGNDVLMGGAGIDHLYGGPGVDTLSGGPGVDYLYGGAGDDVYLFGYGAGQDYIRNDGMGGEDVDTDVIRFDAGIAPNDVTVSRVAGTVLSLPSGEAISVTADSFRVQFADGTTWNLNANPSGTINGTAGADTLSGTALDDTMHGLGGDDYLRGGAGIDHLYGGAGNDILEVEQGWTPSPDVLDGGPGNDLLRPGRGATVVFGRGYATDEVMTIGVGTVSFNADVTPAQVILRGVPAEQTGNPASLRVTLMGSSDALLLRGWFGGIQSGQTIDRFRFADGTTWDLAQIVSRIQTSASSGNDYLRGTPAADVINGGSGDDTFVESEGDDRYLFSRGFGRDTLRSIEPHSGHDRVEFDSTIQPSQVVVSVGALSPGGSYNDLNLAVTGTTDVLVLSDWLYTPSRSIDEVRFASGTVWTAATLAAMAKPATAGGDLIEGTPLADSRDGLAGDDRINGYAGNDTLKGGAGDDYLSGDEGDDVLDGGAGRDRLYGVMGDDSLAGGPDDDVLDGGYGNDKLDGGPGADIMRGGPGNDTYVVDNPDDRVEEREGEGTDTVQSSIAYVLGTGVENLTLTGTVAIDGTGNELDNLIVGNSGRNILIGSWGNDQLNGGTNADVLRGGPGDDSYVVDHASDVVIEEAGEGNDRIESAVSYTLPANVEHLTLTGTAAVNATGNSSANELHGNSAANTLDGKEGADTMIGGAGSDTYVVDNSGDVVIENANAGADLVRSSVTYTLGANVESLTLTGTSAINGTGNALDNVIVGNSAKNVLKGGAGNDLLDGAGGADTMAGGAGDDAYVVDQAGDVVSELANEGLDTVRSLVTHTLGAHFENLTLIGSAAIGGTGNTGANVIIGNGAANVLSGAAGNDVIDGGGGADVMSGGPGDDTYFADDPSDSIIENTNEGIDTVHSAVIFTLGAHLENLTLIGIAPVSATGNALANILIGNDAANVLTGGAGNDTLRGNGGADRMVGGPGDDTYFVDDATDVIVELAGEGTDAVWSSVTHALSANVEALTLTGNAAANATGNELSNQLTGNSANNMLDGRAGADRMSGGLGNDTYVVDHAGDIVIERPNEGTDTVRAGITYTLGVDVENLVLTGSAAIAGTGNAANNVITGNAAANTLSGGAGNDTLDGLGGADTLIGGSGNDVYVVDSVADTVVENVTEGVDTVCAAVSFALPDHVEHLTLTGTATLHGSGNALDNVLTGNSASNLLSGGAGNDTLNGMGGADTLVGGAGNDLYVVDNAADVVSENAGDGIDTVQAAVTYVLGANVENLTLTGSAAIGGTGNALDNVITGNAAANTLDGGAGNDTLDGLGGADTMRGGPGNDTYVVDAVGDLVIENAGEGTDTVRSAVSYTLTVNVENLVLTGSAALSGTGNAIDNVLEGNAAANTLIGGAGNDTLRGLGGADTMHGGLGNDLYFVSETSDLVIENPDEGVDTISSSVSYTLPANVEQLTLTGSAVQGQGNALANVITGNAANNVLDGGAGADRLVGGAGNDTYVVDNAGEVIVESAGEGTDLVQSTASYTLSGNVENLTLTGSAAINATGNTLANELRGNGAANVLDGKSGPDRMIGGGGDDRYVVDDAGDVVIENPNEGHDTVVSAITYALGANVEALTLSGTAAINGTGNALDNKLTGNAAQNVLRGEAGRDVLDGAAGADTLIGGPGDDTYIVDQADDIVVENANEGIDMVLSPIIYTLGPNVENLTLTSSAAIGGTGNALDNVITGNAAANTLDGGAGNDTLDGLGGADTMRGGPGNDTYVVDAAGDLVIEDAGEGTDTVRSAVSYTLTVNVENLVLTGSAALSGTGNALDNLLEGNAAANTLIGGAGNDTLRGLGGADTMHGGLGNDLYFVTETSDLVIENPDEGVDTIFSSVSYTLPANVEQLTLTGSAVQGQGNALANVITGNAANNVLDGGAGADRLVGGAGNDTYVVDSAGDVIVESAGQGTDLVQSTASYTLGANVENLTLTGSAAINGTGNVLANVVTGNGASNTLVGAAGNDLLDGGAGADTLAGGTGDDTYVVDNALDAVIENPNEGVDTVQTSMSYILGPNVENLRLTGTSAVSGTGNALHNVLTGNSAANTLTGGAGNDILDGMAGADRMLGGPGNDVYVVDNAADAVVELANEGIDTVQTGLEYTLGADVENLTLLGTGAVGATGNTLANVLTGNSAGNRLIGGAGNDTLNGMAGADTMHGGTGNDIYIVDTPLDAVIENPNEGTDTVHSPFAYTLGPNVENLVLTGTAAIAGTGNAANNALTGNPAANTLAGLAGDDVLDGAGGADTLLGGIGNDIYVVDHGGDLVIENANEGIDLVRASVSYTLVAHVENLTLTGSAPINATGNAANNTLTGNVANNVLDGGAGADLMSGGAGNDTYIVDNVSDVIVEKLNEGADTIVATVSYTLSANVENLTLIGYGSTLNGVLTGTGNDLDNVITGNQYANILIGGSGNDVLDSGVAQSTFTARDTLVGGPGDDTYLVVNTHSVVTEYLNEGTDTVHTTASFALPDHVENLYLTNPLYPGFDAVLDHYVMLWGEEQLAQNYWEVGQSRYYRVNGEEEKRLAYFDLWGNALDNRVVGADTDDWLEGGGGNDVLLGGRGADVLNGGPGNDTLDGGDGVDSMSGGPGDDTYIVDAADRFWRGGLMWPPYGVENANEGTDLVMSSGTFVLPVNFENLTLTGSAAVDGYGNASANVIRGNAASNALHGAEGADTLYGGAGNDLMTGDAGADFLYGEAGNDVLEGGLDNDTLSDTSGNNVYHGGAGNDTLSGGSGREFFVGGTGNDVITTGSGADIIAFNRGDGQDILNASTGADNTLTLGGGIRYADMTFTRSASDLVFGLGGADRITLKGWYAAAANRSVLNMQVIAEAMAEFDLASSDKLRNRKVVNFDFAGLASAYDDAGAPAGWALTNALLDKHLSGSDVAALGADLSYRYGSRGSLTHMGFDPVQGMLASASFAASAQALQSSAALESGLRRLG